MGWTANSDGGSAKISQPSPASTFENPSTSRRNARSASASRLYRMTCAPLITTEAYCARNASLRWADAGSDD